MAEQRSDDLFQGTAEAVLRAVPRKVGEVYAAQLDQPPTPLDQLLAQSDAYVEELQVAARRNEFLDLTTARRIHDGFRTVCDRIGSQVAPEHHRLLQAAIRYFILDEDSEGDTTSLVGFDDDAAVFNAVAQALGQEDLIIDI